MLPTDPPTAAALRRIPPELAHTVIRRGAWSFCAMEHSRIGAIEFEAPGACFHHIALPLDRAALRFGLHMDGRHQSGRNGRDVVTMIEAGAGGLTRWDGTFESACFYFTDAALEAALGSEGAPVAHDIRTRVDLRAPDLVRLLRAMFDDAAAGQPHGTLVGDAIFLALAPRLATSSRAPRLPRLRDGERDRVRSALQCIHDHLTDRLSVATIATAAATSPYYLNHAFRAAMGCSIWQYVLRERARHAATLMHDPTLSLTQISLMAGFDTYASFISATGKTFGATPAKLRHQLTF